MVDEVGDRPADAPAVAHVFVDALTDDCEISGSDGHHLGRARRLRDGEIVTAADGSGSWRQYRVRTGGRGRVLLAADGEVRFEPTSTPLLAVAFAPAKGARLEATTRHLTELGVDRIVPLATERGVVRWEPARAGRGLDRLGRIAREAAMQARRARVPRVDPVAGVADVAGHPGLVVGDHDAPDADARAAPEFSAPASASEWLAVVGPEGGFTPDERAQLGGGIQLAVGPNVLRSETAAVAIAAVLVRARQLRR